LLISNHNSFRVMFDKIASGCFIWKIYLYFSIGKGQPSPVEVSAPSNTTGWDSPVSVLTISHVGLWSHVRIHFFSYRIGFFSWMLYSCTNHIITRISIQTAGLAFGGTGLCSYRVRGADGSCAEHLTVESHTVFICQQSYLLSFWYSITHSLFHPRLKTFPFCKSSPLQSFLSSS